MRSGYIYPDYNRLTGAGSNGGYWSGRAASSSYAYLLRFYSSDVYPSYSFYRYFGYSVRCLADWE